MTAPEGDVFEFRDGRVVKAHSFGDTAMQERVWGSKREVEAGGVAARIAAALDR